MATGFLAMRSEADGACHGNIEDGRIHRFGAGTLYDDNSKRDITARSLAIFSAGEEPRRKICVWCLILYSLPPEGGGETTARRKQSRRRREGVTRVLVFLRLFAKHRYCRCRFSTMLVSVRVTIIIAVELDDREMPPLSHYRFHRTYHRPMLRWSRRFSARFSLEFLVLRWPRVPLEYPPALIGFLGSLKHGYIPLERFPSVLGKF